MPFVLNFTVLLSCTYSYTKIKVKISTEVYECIIRDDKGVGVVNKITLPKNHPQFSGLGKTKQALRLN